MASCIAGELYKPHIHQLQIHHSNLHFHFFTNSAVPQIVIIIMAAAVDHKTPGFGDLEPASNAKFPVPRCNSFRSASFKLKRPAEKSLTIDDEDSSFDGDQDQNSYYRDLIRKGKDEIEPSILDPRDEGTADSGIMRNPSMIRLTGKHPFNSEPPLDHLMRHGFITPAPLHYVRNHGPVPKTDWASWTIDVTGLVETPTSFTLDQLITGFRLLKIFDNLFFLIFNKEK